jgi:hypothetical protein
VRDSPTHPRKKGSENTAQRKHRQNVFYGDILIGVADGTPPGIGGSRRENVFLSFSNNAVLRGVGKRVAARRSIHLFLFVLLVESEPRTQACRTSFQLSITNTRPHNVCVEALRWA